MNFTEAIKYVHPEMDIEDWEVTDNSDGEGPFISRWPGSLIKPTILELETAWANGRLAREMHSLRRERNMLLVSSDWTQYTDSPLDNEAKTNWATYRQSLRDLPADTPDPANPTWPVAP
jgi:hypothetical protein